MRTTSIPIALLAPTTLFAVALTLAGCATSPGPEPSPSASVDDTAAAPASDVPAPSAPAVADPVVATAPPTAESPADPLTPLTAWATCYSAATTGSVIDPADWDPMPYTAGAVTSEAGVYTVSIGFAPAEGDGYGAAVGCTATGTLGAPVIALGGPTGLG